MHDWLVCEHGYPGSLRSLQRYYRAHFPRPRIRARRRVETPPGAQAQADWGEFPRVLVAGRTLPLSVFALKLSYSRYPAFIWSPRCHGSRNNPQPWSLNFPHPLPDRRVGDDMF